MTPETLESAEKQAEICSLFSNPKRILILWSLAHKPKSVGKIADEIDSTLQNTSQHLRLMKAKGILKATRDGQKMLYQVVNDAVADCCLLTKFKEGYYYFSQKE